MENSSFCQTIFYITEDYISPSLGFVGTILNMLSFVIYVMILRSTTQNHKDHLFKYLLVKSIADTYVSVYVFLNAITKKISSINEKYGYRIFELIVFDYLVFVFELISMLLEVASIFNRFKIFTKTFKLFDKINFKIVIILMFMYSFGFYIHVFFNHLIVKNFKLDKSNITIFFYSVNQKGLGELDTIFGYIHSSVRDVLCVFLILILNIILMIKMRNFIKHKKAIVGNQAKSEQVELKLTSMVIGTTSMTFFGHILTFIEYLKIENITSNECFKAFSDLAFWICNAFNFVLYFYFNLYFRKTFLLFIQKFKLKFLK